MRFFEPYLMNSGNYVVLSAAAIIFFFSLPVFSGAGSAIWTLNYADQKNNSQPSSSSPSYSKIIFYGIILISFSFCFTFFFYFGYVFLSLLFCLASIPVIAFWFSGVNLAELLLPDFAVLNRLCVYCDLKANQPDIKNVDTDRNDSMKSRKTWSDVCSISPAYLQIVAILVPFIFIRGSKIGMEKISFLNTVFISIIAIILPSFIAIWSFTFTKKYYRDHPLKGLLYGVSPPIIFVFFFLAATSSFYSQFSERVMFESNLGFYQIRFLESHYPSKKNDKTFSKNFCLFAMNLDQYYIFPIKTIENHARTIDNIFYSVRASNISIKSIIHKNKFSSMTQISTQNFCPPVYIKKASRRMGRT